MGFGPRILSGLIDSDGTIRNGSGFFQVTRQTAGEYVISFDQPFPDIPVIVGKQNLLDPNTRDNVVFPVVNSYMATAVTGATDGHHVDRSFSFIAIGGEDRFPAIRLCISGAINRDGSIVSGNTWFKVTHQGPGEYLIRFDYEFPQVPAIVGSQINWGDTNQNTLDNVVFSIVDTRNAIAYTGATDGHRVDRSFSFIAVGEGL